ncbi:MAG: acylase [Acidobacteriaceae bacterium]|nr:acylase [Acidobacteriaceae bacterium]
MSVFRNSWEARRPEFWAIVLVLVLSTPGASFGLQPPSHSDAELSRWQQEARNVTILRDDWGIAHVYGKTDAAAVFGMIYAQAEDDFNRVEINYINAMGRLAEAEGESKLYQDLRMKLFVDPTATKQQYVSSPQWLKLLMNALADGLNYYLYKHPEVKPRVIQRFEPWMALTFTEGSIGGDIERIDIQQLQAFYSRDPKTRAIHTHAYETLAANDSDLAEPGGSNGIAIGPSNTVAHHALLLINPHTTFYFRSELHIVSEEGLNAYGAVTWGQFFVYQGFNERAGWMHTSSGVDAVDEYLETVQKKGDAFYYRYGNEERPVTVREITIRYKTPRGMAEKKFTVFRTHHGPVIREINGKWVSIRLMQEPVKALIQSFTRTKAHDYKSIRETMELHANSTNNTIFADAHGNIAYFHANFIPRRDTSFDWTKPVDGSNPRTEWQGLLSVDETPHLLNPKSGWLYNSNNWPWSAAGPSSPKSEDYPVYVETGTESARGLHAIRLLQNRKDFTLDSLRLAAYDSYLPWFEKPLASLIKAWDQTRVADPLKTKVAAQISMLRNWDLRSSVTSIPTSLAVFWGDDLRKNVLADARNAGMLVEDYIASRIPPRHLLQSLSAASDRLDADFGTWRTPWGNINRFQRLTDDLVQPFSDSKPSIPVGFTYSAFGSLASFAARPFPGTKKWYGTAGNSFVALVEFGDTVRAKAVTAGGESGDPASPHFNDEAERYSTGNLRDVYFYPDDVARHTARKYHPGS